VFTGLIETVGSVRAVSRRGAAARLEIRAKWPDGTSPALGDSIAVNGACLTVVDPDDQGFAADLSPETVRTTRLTGLRAGDPVNLERALRLGDRLDGHIVQGHVDTTTRLLEIRPAAGFEEWRLALPEHHGQEIALKGSVALDGVSLTVSALGSSWFAVALIPETLRATTFGSLRAGSELHLETDVLAKYIARHLGGRSPGLVEQMFGNGGRHA
jgi:riboflavin synthase